MTFDGRVPPIVLGITTSIPDFGAFPVLSQLTTFSNCPNLGVKCTSPAGLKISEQVAFLHISHQYLNNHTLTHTLRYIIHSFQNALHSMHSLFCGPSWLRRVWADSKHLSFLANCALDFDVDDLNISPAQESALGVIEDRIDAYDDNRGFDALDDAMETTSRQFAATQTAHPTGNGNPRDYTLFEIARVEAGLSYAASQTIVTGAARQSLLSDMEDYVSGVKSAVGITTSTRASATGSGSSSIATGESVTPATATGGGAATGDGNSGSAGAPNSAGNSNGVSGMFSGVVGILVMVAVL
ncbi:hypothetical protein K440DRAFT_641772 [Wilcoxina mikolae CBS 423.85]|nr:hypothetical protein K440DRAFT_641772 [Wilcoxina mikolae CBS 423.85]